jgi:hypothetical protein
MPHREGIAGKLSNRRLPRPGNKYLKRPLAAGFVRDLVMAVTAKERGK